MMHRLILSLFLTLLFTSCVRFPYSPPQISPPSTPKQESIWLVFDKLHSDFVVETQWLLANGCKLPASIKSYKYLCFGWGDRIAYTRRWRCADITQALFWPSESIVQVVAFNTEVVPTFPKQDVLEVQVPAEGGISLANFLNNSFSFTSENQTAPITLQPAKWGHGYFLKSPYSYYFPRMCNQWVSTALQCAGVDTTSPSITMSSQTLKKDFLKYQEKMASASSTAE